MATRTNSTKPNAVSKSAFDCGSDSIRPTLPEATPTRHPDYFFPDGELYIRVHDTVFRVHRYFFTKYSSYFRCLLSPSTSNADQTNGLTEEDPLCIDPALGISTSEFGQLLWVFYDETFDRIASGDKWMSILFTAEKFKMDNVCYLAVEKLKDPSLSCKYDAVAKISVHQRYFVPPSWARQAYMDMCLRPERLTVAEGKRIGLAAAMMIARVQGELTNIEDSSRLPLVNAAVDGFLKDQPLSPEPPKPIASLDNSIPYECDVGGTLQIKGKTQTFNVHRCVLVRHSSVIQSLFADSTPGCLTLSSLSDLHFSWVLWALYDRGLTVSASPTQWNAIRLTAERLRMGHLCAVAINQICNSLDPIDLIVVIERSNAKGEWVDKAWDTLRQRNSPLTQDEWKRLGASTLSAVAKVAGARERWMWLEIQRLTAIVEELRPEKPRLASPMVD